jgi:hypothetical protein
VTNYEPEDRISGVRYPTGAGNFSLLHRVHRQILGPTQPPIQWEPGAFSLGVKRPGREPDQSPPSNAGNAWSYTSILPVRLHDVVLS